ncbi:MAG: hypothetical protein WBM50_18235 [Acidimicrobiales bacterium]
MTDPDDPILFTARMVAAVVVLAAGAAVVSTGRRVLALVRRR